MFLINRVVYALIIINKAGGLIYQRDFADGLNKLSINDYLVLAGTFHGYVFRRRFPSELGAWILRKLSILIFIWDSAGSTP